MDTIQQDELEAVNQRFNAELQRQIGGKLPLGYIYQLGMPNNILQSADIPNLPIEMAASRLNDKSMQENHPFDLSEVRDLPRAIQNPLAVFRSATHIGSFVIMTEIEHKGKNYVVALEANRKRENIEVNSIRSVYPKNNRQVANWINEGLTNYAHKPKMLEWLTKQRSNSADVSKPFIEATKVIQTFENTKFLDKKNEKSEKKFQKAVPSAALSAVHKLTESKLEKPVDQKKRQIKLS
jgi:hypothetical protein